MQFYWPLKEVHITQKFGNKSKSYAIGYHMGIDLRAPRRTPVYAAESGKVAVAKTTAPFDGYGCHIAIDHLNGLFSVYAHLDECIVIQGQDIAIGQLIGYSGGNAQDYPKPKSGYTKAGFSTAYHLHYEIDKGAISAAHCIDPTPITTVLTQAALVKPIPEWAKMVAEKAKKKGVINDWTNPLQMVCDEKAEWIFEKLGLLDPTKHEGGVSLARFAIIQDKLGLFDKIPDKK
jgi:murein DD-endopeptidase MepM/ murein hydrolase activator NlpD